MCVRLTCMNVTNLSHKRVILSRTRHLIRLKKHMNATNLSHKRVILSPTSHLIPWIWLTNESCCNKQFILSRTFSLAQALMRMRLAPESAFDVRVCAHTDSSLTVLTVASPATHVQVMSHMDKSCHTYQWIMSHASMSHSLMHVTHMNASCSTYQWDMPHTWMPHIWMRQRLTWAYATMDDACIKIHDSSIKMHDSSILMSTWFRGHTNV